MVDHLQVLYDVLINGTEATNPKWNRLIAASAVDKALKQRKRLAELEAAATSVEQHLRLQETAFRQRGFEQTAILFKKLADELANAASSPALGTEKEGD